MTPAPFTRLSRIAYARLPTPLDEAPRLARALRLSAFTVKREDLSGDALGGNKLRQMDFILAEAMAQRVNALVTTAAAQSNFCRALAGACARLGLQCHLLLRGEPGQPPGGNLLLGGLFGATITWTPITDPWDPAVSVALEQIAANLVQSGQRPYIIQLPARSAGLAAVGWAEGAAELAAQWDASGADPAVLAVACGSGLTAAGLALGLKRLGRATRVLGISVQQPAPRLLPWMVEAANRAAALAGWETQLLPGDLDVTDDQVAPGYGKPSPASLAAVRLAGREAGLVLDPVYSGKALAGLAACIRDGRVPAGASVTLLHSGGAPGLFYHAASFA